MEIENNSKADVMYIRFNNRPFHKNRVLANGLVVVDLAEDGTVIGLELISPSLYVDNPHEITYRVEDSTVAPTEH
jgi:uncharacterized protein YuzE